MNRTLTHAAAVLGIGPRKLRTRLRELGLLNAAGELASSERGCGRLFVDTRARWNPSIGAWTHYGVVMVTERGMPWLAELAGVAITRMPSKDAA